MRREPHFKWYIDTESEALRWIWSGGVTIFLLIFRRNPLDFPWNSTLPLTGSRFLYGESRRVRDKFHHQP
jgi:hypothetical protein